MENMKTQPLISILTPCFNGATYLERCIQSVLAQDYPNVEHIIQDANSQDGTREILQRYSDRVDWISEPDNGQSDGLNKAIQRCRGEIFLVLNADDELLPHAASWGAEQMEKYPEDAAIYGDQHNIDPAGNTVLDTIGPDPYDFAKIFCVEDVIPAQAAFIRRTSMEAVGWYADVTRKTCPDYEMWVRLGLKFPMRHVPGFIARYRLHPDSEGCQEGLLDAFLTAKREVMDRVFADPETPENILNLKRRAYAGLLWWTADSFLYLGQAKKAFWRAAKAMTVCPGLRLLRKVPGFLRVCWLASHNRWGLTLIASEPQDKQGAQC